MTFDYEPLLASIAANAAHRAASVDRGAFPTETVHELGAAGLLGLISAEEVGGKGLGLAAAVTVVERIARECGSTAMVVCMHYCATAPRGRGRRAGLAAGDPDPAARARRRRRPRRGRPPRRPRRQARRPRRRRARRGQGAARRHGRCRVRDRRQPARVRARGRVRAQPAPRAAADRGLRSLQLHRARRHARDREVPRAPFAITAGPDRWHRAERAGGDAPVAHPPARRGLAARGALVEAGAPELDLPLAVWADEAARLYALAAAAQWDPVTAIPWHAPIDHPDEVEDAVVQIMTYLIENETAALLVPVRFLGKLHPHFCEVMQLLAIQAADEARHIEVFTRRARLRRRELGLSTASGQASLATLFDETEFAVAAMLLAVLGEGGSLA